MTSVELYVDRFGQIRCLYTEAIDLGAVGAVSVTRASHVEPDGDGGWSADLSPAGGPRLGPFSRRSEALDAESAWLTRHVLSPTEP